jgi:hypothetical protein
MQNRLQGLGYQSAPVPGGVLRSHTFHHSIIETPVDPIAYGERLYNTSPGGGICAVTLARFTGKKGTYISSQNIFLTTHKHGI